MAITLRPPRDDDLDWVVRRHGALYTGEYGWNEEFEVLVAGIVEQFRQNFDPTWEGCWIAEVDGGRVGSVFMVHKSDTVAKLRLLFVEQMARGQGVGRALVEECIRYARERGYRQIVLWTNSCLLPARHIYETAGFRMIEAEPHHSFGVDLVGETWILDL